MIDLEKFHSKNNTVLQQKYPEIFDPKWIVMESGWPYFHLSVLDNQPWQEMYKEAEALSDKFYTHREDTYGKGWKSLTLHGVNDDTQSLNTYSDRQDTLKQLDWTWVADECPVTKKFLTEVWPAEFLNRVDLCYLNQADIYYLIKIEKIMKND